MRKGQQKLLNKAADWGKSARSVLENESFTLSELDKWYRILYYHKDEEFDMDLIEKLHDIAFRNKQYIHFYTSYISLAEFWELYQALIEKHDPVKAVHLLNMYSHLNSYQEQPVCSFEDVEKLYEHCDSLNEWLPYGLCPFRGYFSNALYTGDNLDAIIRAERIKNEYFSMHSLTSQTALSIENIFSDEELEEIFNDRSSAFMLDKCYLYLFQKYFPDTYKICLELYDNDENIDKSYKPFLSYLKGFIITEPDKIKAMKKIFDVTDPDSGLTFHLKGSPYFMSIGLSLQGFSIACSVGNEYVGRYRLSKDDALVPYIKPDKSSYPFNFSYLFFYDNNTVYKKTQRGRWVPCTYKNFLHLYDANNDLCNILFNEYANSQIEKGHYIWKDLKQNDYHSTAYLPPFTIEELNNHYSLDELMKSKYKHADFVNWNKCDIQWCYAIMQMLPKVNEQSKNLLLSLKYDRGYQTIYPLSKGERMNSSAFAKFLLDRLDSYVKLDQYWDDSTDGHKQDTLQIIRDYFRLCQVMHRKINLCFSSGQKLKDAHDELAVELRSKSCAPIKIPKNTKFKALDKCLPDWFEKMTTTKRIVQEGVQQHNCVASYIPDINSDYCAIYSFVYKNERYTVEFQKNPEGYYINQLYKACNHIVSEDVWEMVHSYLDQANQNAA